MAQTEHADETPKTLNNMRKDHIARVLETAGYDLDRTAEILEISPAEPATWMAKYNLSRRNVRPEVEQ